MSKHHRSNRRDKLLTVQFREKCRGENAPCWICREPIDYTLPTGQGLPDSFERDHYYPASTHPHLYDDPSNFRPSHALCNARRGNGTPTRTQQGLGEPVTDWW